MAWLGEELPEAEPAHVTPFAPRCVKDSLEEALVTRGRDLISMSQWERTARAKRSEVRRAGER